MGTESIEASFLSIFALISFFIFLLTSKYSHKIKGGALLDRDFLKPQAFHETPVTRSGGIASIISLSIFFYIYYLLYEEVLYNYIFISCSVFIIGFLDDLRINIKPLSRLIIMIILLFVSIYLLPIKILNVDIPFLTSLMSSHIFSSIFVLLCFLFVINGANLIDGFNGLLTINLIIINVILAFININNNNLEFSILIISQIIILLSFLLFNFPSAKIFLGDSGAYTMGALTGLNTIITNNLNSTISSFFFCTLLFYLFFEVLFSFLRKILQKKSPIHPDNKHLHMLSFYRISRNYGKNRGNYLNSIIINLSYLILVIPGLYLMHDPQLSRYWFFILLIIYSIIYSRLYYFNKDSAPRK
jgi:UDP-N-acetylmuramyl pentapeptide phosphotransferase/UDP-N-acetylglucosamine-1-phosphate transferase